MFFCVILIGLCIGSFLNVCIYRIAREESIVYPQSRCNDCGYKLTPKDLVPVISYINLKGRCRKCNEKISIMYPVVEIINSIVYGLLFLKYGLTISFIKCCIFFSLILVIGIIDYKTKFVYKSTIVFGVLSGITMISIEYISLGNDFGKNLLGAFIGLIILWCIIKITNGMGEGDVEVAVICGLYLSWQGVLLILFIAFTVGGILGIFMMSRKREYKREIPFVPFMSIGAVVTILYGNQIIDWYSKLLM